MVYNPGYYGKDWSFKDKLLTKKLGLYTIHRLSFDKILFYTILRT